MNVKQLLIPATLLICSLFYLAHGTIARSEATGDGFDCTAVSEIPQLECGALVALYQSTGGSMWENSAGWLLIDNPCHWHGVWCNGENVIELDLQGNGLVGNVPAEIGYLTQLRQLDLSNNQLSQLPQDIGVLTKLIELDLGYNRLSEVPREIGDLPSLARLHLNHNHLSTLPARISKLSKLERLYLNHNWLHTLPNGIGALTGLTVLDLGHNQLSQLPAQVGNLSSLTILDLGHNQLDELPMEVSKLSSLAMLMLGYNQLSMLPQEMDNLSQLVELDLAYNRLQTSDNSLPTTQTVAPSDVAVSRSVDTELHITWEPIAYTDHGGYYEISYRPANGEYKIHGRTTSKSDSDYKIRGLDSAMAYYVRVRTYTPAHDNQQNDLWSDYTKEVSARNPDDGTPLPDVTIVPIQPRTSTPTATMIPTAIPTMVEDKDPNDNGDSSETQPIVGETVFGQVPAGISPLATDCRDITPPGNDILTACLVGMVYFNGEPITDASVTITNRAGESATVYARKRAHSPEPRAYYHLDMGNDAFRVESGESFTIHAAHNGSEKTVKFAAQQGRQQVDIVLPSTHRGSPIGTINTFSDQNFDEGGKLMANGMGQAQLATDKIVAHLWESDRYGHLGGAPSLEVPMDRLSPGNHQISFSVQDSQGNWSDPVIEKIFVPGTPESEWVMLLYLAGDYNDGDKLWNVFHNVLDRLENVDNPALRIAAQVDGHNRKPQRWTFEPNQGTQVARLSQNSIREVAMDDPQVLADFLRWGQEKFPAEHYYLVIADHGQGAQGIAWDSTSDWVDDEKLNDSTYLTIQELGIALDSPGVAPVDVLHLDACSMNLVETAYELGNHTPILISSQYLGWDYFAYDQYADLIHAETTPVELGESIVEAYSARAAEDDLPHTISAINMDRAVVTLNALDDLAATLVKHVDDGDIDKQSLQDIRSAVQSFDSQGNLQNDEADLYIDLKDWSVQLENKIGVGAIQRKAATLTKELDRFILSNRASSGELRATNIALDTASGISIFYPHQLSGADRSYMAGELFKFTEYSRWTDFLGASLSTVQGNEPVVSVPKPLNHLELMSELFPEPTSTHMPSHTPMLAATWTATNTPTPEATWTPTDTPAPTHTPTPTPDLTATSEAEIIASATAWENFKKEVESVYITDPRDAFPEDSEPEVIEVEDGEGQAEIGVTYSVELRDDLVKPGDTITFDINFTNNSDKVLYGVVIKATVPENTFFRRGGGVHSPQNVDVQNRGIEWELSDESRKPCPDYAPSGTMCIFLLGTVYPDEETIDIAFSADIDEMSISADPDSQDIDTFFHLNTEVAFANLDKNQLILLEEVSVANIAQPTTTELEEEPLDFNVYLPVMIR